jgi:glycosyltransferase involved in cell wall biosynthesis
MNPTVKILHIVDTLPLNGRTILLRELACHLTPSFTHVVLTLRHQGKFAPRLIEMGVPVEALNLYSPLRGLHEKRKTISRILAYRPDICIGWSGDANLTSTIFRLFGVPVIWTIHNSIARWNTVVTRMGVRLAALLSGIVPENVVCCSNKTFDVYRDVHHFKKDKLTVIANGVDHSRFRPNKAERERVRRELGIQDHTLVIATAARVGMAGEPRVAGDFKDLDTLFRAAAIVCRQKSDTTFLLFGSNLTEKNEWLVGQLKDYGLLNNVRLLGVQDNVAALFAASDIFALSSGAGEGLPVSLLEAMASGTVPVCTDSGDIAKVVGSAGLIVPQKDANKLAAAMLSICSLSKSERAEYSRRAVGVVVTSYSIERVARRYGDLIAQAVS